LCLERALRQPTPCTMPANPTMRGQDWETVTFGTQRTDNKPSTSSAATQKRPAPVMTVTKAGISARKLDDETENLKHASVGTDLRVALQRARQAKGMTQKALATSLNMDTKLVVEYEAGRGIPNNAVIARLEKSLGVKLPRAPKRATA